MALIISEPGCFGDQLGSITVSTSGGVPPYQYSIDGTNFQSSSTFGDLDEGVYQIVVKDENDCTHSEIIWINVPLQVNVELGDNVSVIHGDSVTLDAIVNIPFDSLAAIGWTGIHQTECPTCLTQLVAPVLTTTYAIQVSSIDGCVDSDSLQVTVVEEGDLYVPNIFTPNGDGLHDLFVVEFGTTVPRVISCVIFDRWGNMVFEKNNIDTTIEPLTWDGTNDGQMLSPGVYTYRMEVLTHAGKVKVVYGDVTLVR
jgi:gliding motility-associated-like protein